MNALILYKREPKYMDIELEILNVGHILPKCYLDCNQFNRCSYTIIYLIQIYCYLHRSFERPQSNLKQ